MKRQLTKELPPEVLQAVKQACQTMAAGPYKATGIKFEMEAQLNRNDYGGGDYCSNCSGDGDNICYNCDGEGSIRTGDDEYEPCDNCDNGHVECDYCDGSGRVYDEDSWTNERCLRFILKHVAQATGATFTDNIVIGEDDHPYAESYNPMPGVIYSRFYNDGSVDSENSTTVGIPRPDLIPPFKRAFKALSEEIGNGLGISGAGFHIAILNSPGATYPEGNRLDPERARNFASAMQHFIPALLFLASADYKSRGLGYRNARIDNSEKYSLISGRRHTCYEYRMFETCYDRPEAVYDYLMVIANTLKFYTLKFKTAKFFGTVGRLPIIDGRGLWRFYFTEKHLDALEAGLQILKPSYKTVYQLKSERSFKISKEFLAKRKQKLECKFTIEYADYAERERYAREVRIAELKADYHNRNIKDVSEPVYVAKRLKEYYHPMMSCEAYIKDRMDNVIAGNTNAMVTI